MKKKEEKERKQNDKQMKIDEKKKIKIPRKGSPSCALT